MRKKILAANWKMNLLHEEAIQLISEFNRQVELTNPAIEVVVFSPSLYIHELSQQTNFKIGVQNFYFEKSGAFTGELSISQVKSCGANSLLIGHSERRQIFGESDELLKSKVNAADESNMPFIFCCGEALEHVTQKNIFNLLSINCTLLCFIWMKIKFYPVPLLMNQFGQ
jgi:triosephosphate isomerase